MSGQQLRSKGPSGRCTALLVCERLRPHFTMPVIASFCAQRLPSTGLPLSTALMEPASKAKAQAAFNRLWDACTSFTCVLATRRSQVDACVPHCLERDQSTTISRNHCYTSHNRSRIMSCNFLNLLTQVQQAERHQQEGHHTS